MPSSHLNRLYRNDWGLFTDLYQLTMASGYWQHDMAERQAVFHLYYRRNPFGHPYVVTAGLALAVDLLQHLRFSVHDIQYLGALRAADGSALFSESFLNYLQRLRFRCHIDAMPEGTVAFPNQPLLRVEGPLLQAQLIETALLTLINFSSLIATKAARIRQVAGDDQILEFGLRRAQGIDGGLTASRSAYIGGCDGTSNVLAGRMYGIPVRGTHAHSWVMCFDTEMEAFEAYAEAMPANCILLVDTYDTIEGVRRAIQVGHELQSRGHSLLGIRLDSGDLSELSKTARRMLDEAGFREARIVASNDLDEYKIGMLKQQGAPIAVWGVGTRLVTAYDQPALGGVYKLAMIADEDGRMAPRLKLSEQAVKVSNPGRLQVRRYFNEQNLPVRDVLYHQEIDKPASPATDNGYGPSGEGVDLLRPIFRDGQLVYDLPDLQQIRDYSLQQQQGFAGWTSERVYPAGLDPRLSDLKERLIAKYRQKN